MSKIHVNIDRLVLPPMNVADRNALVRGLQAELRRRLSDPATRADWAKSHRTPMLRLGRMPMEPGPAGGAKFGTTLGQSIGKGLKP